MDRPQLDPVVSIRGPTRTRSIFLFSFVFSIQGPSARSADLESGQCKRSEPDPEASIAGSAPPHVDRDPFFPTTNDMFVPIKSIGTVAAGPWSVENSSRLDGGAWSDPYNIDLIGALAPRFRFTGFLCMPPSQQSTRRSSRRCLYFLLSSLKFEFDVQQIDIPKHSNRVHLPYLPVFVSRSPS